MWSRVEHRGGRPRRAWSPGRVAFLFAVLAAMGAGSGNAAETRTLHLGSTPWSPFTNTPGQARFAIDLVHMALHRVGITADTAIVAEGTLTHALLERRFDGSPALWRDDEREKSLVYSRPYLENRLVLVGRRGSDVSASVLSGLPGKRIALVEGYSYGELVKGPTGPTYVPAATVEESIQKVLDGEADYTLTDELVVQYLVRNHADKVQERLALGSVPLIVRTLHFAVRRDLPDARSIVDRFDAELGRMIADRSYHRLLQLDWIDVDVDGDGRPESVPASDRAGSSPPARTYELMAAKTPSPAPSGGRFYLGGQVYDGWANVPDRYKVFDPGRTAWGSTIAPVFSFKW